MFLYRVTYRGFIGYVLPQLDIINLIKQLLCVNCELLDWSEVDLLLRILRHCIPSRPTLLFFPFIFIVCFVYDFIINK